MKISYVLNISISLTFSILIRERERERKKKYGENTTISYNSEKYDILYTNNYFFKSQTASTIQICFVALASHSSVAGCWVTRHRIK